MVKKVEIDRTAKLITLLFVNFSLIIHNVTLLPHLTNRFVIATIVIVTIGLAVSSVYFSFLFQNSMLKLYAKDVKLQRNEKKK